MDFIIRQEREGHVHWEDVHNSYYFNCAHHLPLPVDRQCGAVWSLLVGSIIRVSEARALVRSVHSGGLTGSVKPCTESPARCAMWHSSIVLCFTRGAGLAGGGEGEEEGRREEGVVVVVVQTIDGACVSLHACTPLQLVRKTKNILRRSLRQQVAGAGHTK